MYVIWVMFVRSCLQVPDILKHIHIISMFPVKFLHEIICIFIPYSLQYLPICNMNNYFFCFPKFSGCNVIPNKVNLKFLWCVSKCIGHGCIVKVGFFCFLYMVLNIWFWCTGMGSLVVYCEDVSLFVILSDLYTSTEFSMCVEST